MWWEPSDYSDGGNTSQQGLSMKLLYALGVAAIEHVFSTQEAQGVVASPSTEKERTVQPQGKDS